MQYTTSSNGGGVDANGQCDGGEFKLDTAAVTEEAAVECKEVRWMGPSRSCCSGH
jgi:hypothetical protein